jgi:4-amino-4-deoxy-L-arabinose transferase-like glycosyltransferase
MTTAETLPPVPAADREPADVPVADVAPAQSAVRNSQSAIRPCRRHLYALAAITLLGALLRFSFPSLPLLWGDDAYTIYRTHADYQSMLDILQNDGFTPLHYELYWLLGRVAGTENSPLTPGGPDVVHSTGLTPAAIRLLPAFFGTLMVPAMYFLAAQLVRRRTALVVALVTACSAYLLGYSRDMKMYMMVWCFSALSAGTLLWWLRTGARVAFLAWVAASLAMASSHMTGMALLPFEALFFLTRANVRWRQSILFVLGLAVAVLPPGAYMTQFNKWVQEEVEDFGFEVEGLGWVVEYNRDRTGPELLRYATSAYLFGWEWPREIKPENAGVPRARAAILEDATPSWILAGLQSATVMFLMIAAVGAMPWSRALRGIQPDAAPSPQPAWRLGLWLGLWIVIPTYFLYARSMPNFAGPKVWWDAAASYVAGDAWRDPADGAVRGAFWFWLLPAAAGAAILSAVLPKFRRAAVTVIPLAALTLLVVTILRTPPAPPAPADPDWTARVESALKPLAQWADWITDPLACTAMLVLLPGLILYYAAPTWRRRFARAAQFALVAAALVGCCAMVHAFVQGKYDKEVQQVEKQMTTNPQIARQMERFPGPTPRDQAKAYVDARVWQSIFMPRYTGFVWIAFCIALCALFMRLPTRFARAAAVTLFLAVNLTQFGGRLFAGTEPPLDRVAQDVWAHDSHNPRGDPTTARVYVNDAGLGPGHPGFGTLNGQQGKYYLGLARGHWIHPLEWKRYDAGRYFDIHTPRDGKGGGGNGGGRGAAPLDYDLLAADVRRSPQLRRIIVWEKLFDTTPAAAARDKSDPLAGLLPQGWKRRDATIEDHPVRFHWTWANLYTYRRTEYVRE